MNVKFAIKLYIQERVMRVFFPISIMSKYVAKDYCGRMQSKEGKYPQNYENTTAEQDHHLWTLAKWGT